MVAFSRRPFCYQIGVLLLMVATAIFTVGLAVPWWARTYSETGSQVIRHSGLWLGCSSSATGKCKPIDAPGWFKAVQGMQCVALAGMLVACAYAAFVNCCLDNLNFSRTVEILTGIAGSLGLISCILYVVKTSHVLRQNKQIGYSWAFGIDIGACVLVIFIAAIVALSNSRHHHQQNEARFIIHAAEDGYDEAYRSRPRRRRSRSRSKSGGADNDGARAELALERSPGRTRRLGATSGADPEMIALQDGYSSGQEGHQQLLPSNGVRDLQPSGGFGGGVGANALCTCLFRSGGCSPCGTPRCTVENLQPRLSSTGGQLSEHHYYHHYRHSPSAVPAVVGQPSEQQQHHHHQLCKPGHHDQQQLKQQEDEFCKEQGVVCLPPERQLCGPEHSHHHHNHQYHHHSDHQLGKTEHPHPHEHHHHHPFHLPQENHQTCQRIVHNFVTLDGDSTASSSSPKTIADSCCRPGVVAAGSPLCPGRPVSGSTPTHQCHCGQKYSDYDSDSSPLPKARTKGSYSLLPTVDVPAVAVSKSDPPPAYPGEERNNTVLPTPACSGGCSCAVVPPRVGIRSSECGVSQATGAVTDKTTARQYFADFVNCPRVIATAPPLEDDEAEDKDRSSSQEFSQTQYFMRSETVFIGERRGREQ